LSFRANVARLEYRSSTIGDDVEARSRKRSARTHHLNDEEDPYSNEQEKRSTAVMARQEPISDHVETEYAFCPEQEAWPAVS
jgi:hypothetical protein